MNKITIGVIVGIVALAGWYVVSDKSDKTAVGGGDSGSGQLELVSENNFDFGEILMTGGDVTTSYTLKNTGTEPVGITKVSTSCMCTTANVFDLEGESVGKFGMGGAHGPNPKISLEIPAGGEIKVDVTYDPMAHGPDATGKLSREVYLDTDNGETIKLKFKGVGVKKLSATAVKKEQEAKDEKVANKFKNITSVQLETMLGDKDFTMIDVHAPEQEHIPGTDYMISYDQTEKIIAQIPNKDAKVVLYCRSGGMSKVTAKALVDKGYTNVYNLENGANEWKAGGREVLPKGSVEQK